MSDVKTRVEEIQALLEDHPTDRGLRPAFDALWHLEVLEAVGESKSAIRVVVMDTPLDHDHPNLKDAVNTALMRDFSVFDDGAFVIHATALDDAGLQQRDNLAADDSAWSPDSSQREVVNTENKQQLGSHTSVDGIPGNRSALTRPVAGAHGTAIAGLVGARAAQAVPFNKPAYIGSFGDEDKPTDLHGTVTLPYEGVNPACEIIPVSLTAAPYSRMVLGALEYVHALKADVVVVAAAWRDAADLTADCEGWAKVDAALADVSQKAVVLCAAGNDPVSTLAYPASLAIRDGGGDKPLVSADNNIWAVGSCDETGRTLSYAPDILDNIRMIQTLSTEHPPAYSDEGIEDPWLAQFEAIEKASAINPNTFFPARDIISLDPRGTQGYNPSEYAPRFSGTDGETQEPYLEIGSLFTRFSGSSASTAIAAGLISLILSPRDDRVGGGAAPLNIGAVPSKTDRKQLFNLSQAKSYFGS